MSVLHGLSCRLYALEYESFQVGNARIAGSAEETFHDFQGCSAGAGKNLRVNQAREPAAGSLRPTETECLSATGFLSLISQVKDLADSPSAPA